MSCLQGVQAPGAPVSAPYAHFASPKHDQSRDEDVHQEDRPACFSGRGDGLRRRLVVGGKAECMRKDEGIRGLQQVADVLRKKMCIITGNTVLLYAHLSFEGRRYRTY